MFKKLFLVHVVFLSAILQGAENKSAIKKKLQPSMTRLCSDDSFCIDFAHRIDIDSKKKYWIVPQVIFEFEGEQIRRDITQEDFNELRLDSNKHKKQAVIIRIFLHICKKSISDLPCR